MRFPAPALLLVAALAGPAAAQQSTTPTFVQGAAFSSASRVSTLTVTLTRPVAQGDLLVGWFSQFDAPEEVQVSDDVNGTWTRVPGSLTFMSDTGDIALYYRENSQAAPSGITITVSVSSTAYLQGSVAEYSGVALPPPRPRDPPPPPASRPAAWPPPESPSPGRRPPAASPATPCTETVPPSGRRGPTRRRSWTRTRRRQPATRIRSTPSTSRTIIRRRRHLSRSPRPPCHPYSSRARRPRPPTASRRTP